MIAIVDYGIGNLRSVVNAFREVGADVQLVDRPEPLAEARAIVLPGVGAFGDGMANLRAQGLVEALGAEVLANGKPFLGICLGMQMLARSSSERGAHAGLGWLNGSVDLITPSDPQFRVPHIGWNSVQLRPDSRLFAGIADGAAFYFVHSYALRVDPSLSDVVAATCWHGMTVTAATEQGHIFGVQFHPEKSQQDGLQVLKNFVDLIPNTHP